jgi:photosynthetic reaction center cytochrome c subunit
MRQTLVPLRRVGAAIALTMTMALFAAAQAQPQSLEGKTAEQAYKNIHVLQATPATELIQSMHLITGALGVTCDYCHEEQSRDKDTKKPKETARRMMKMVMDINKNTFNGEPVVTCYTCHRGSIDPVNVPIFPMAEPKREEAPPSPSLPAADQILTRYIQALGGEQAIRKVTSRVITATQFIPTGPGGTVPVPAQTEQYRKAPNLMVNVYHTPTYTISEGFDGTTRWAQDPAGRVIDAIKIDQSRARRNSDFYESLHLKQEYKKIAVSGIETVNNREAYLVIGDPEGDSPERLYFDTQTGLLLRKVTVLPTSAGESPYEVNYDDYRDTGSGVKFPFLIRTFPAGPRTELTQTAIVRVQKIQDNVPIEDGKFAKPPSKAITSQQ